MHSLCMLNMQCVTIPIDFPFVLHVFFVDLLKYNFSSLVYNSPPSEALNSLPE